MRWTIVLALAPQVAFAAPLRLVHQGRVLDGAGAPLAGTHAVTVSIHDAATGGTQVFSEVDTVAFDDGYFSTVLGDQSALDLDLLGDTLWVAFQVDGGAEVGARTPLASVPFALKSARAEVAGTLSLACAGGRTLKSTGTAWDCGDDLVLTDAQVRTAVQTGPVDLAAGSTLDGTPISTLTRAAVRADLGGTAVALAAGSTVGGVAVATADDLPDAGDLAATLDGVDFDLGPGTTLDGADLATMMDLDGFVFADQSCQPGAVVIGVDDGGVLTCGPLQLTGGLSCGPGDAGRLQFESGALQVCDGDAWVALSPASATTCHNGVQDPGEGGVDCGGACGACATAHWTFDGHALDVGGGEHHGTVHGAVATTDRFGAANGAFAFDGANDWIEIPSAPALEIASTVTLALWVRRSEPNHLDVLVEKGGDWTRGGTNYGVGLHTAGNDHMFYFFFGGGWRATTGPADVDWHHLVVTATHGAPSVRFWIDGDEKTVTNQAGGATVNLVTSADPVAVGAQRDAGLDYFATAVIDDLRIWSRALGEDEIAVLYADRP